MNSGPAKADKKYRGKLARKKGFTLIEIMVVVMIIGMLATVTTVAVMDYLEKAKRKATAAQISAFGTALDGYYLDNGIYPTTEQGLDALVRPPSSSPQPKNYNPNGYLRAENVPLDPWMNEYVYSYDGNKFYIESFGADGMDGGEGRNADIESWNLSAE